MSAASQQRARGAASGKRMRGVVGIILQVKATRPFLRLAPRVGASRRPKRGPTDDLAPAAARSPSRRIHVRQDDLAPLALATATLLQITMRSISSTVTVSAVRS